MTGDLPVGPRQQFDHPPGGKGTPQHGGPVGDFPGRIVQNVQPIGHEAGHVARGVVPRVAGRLDQVEGIAAARGDDLFDFAIGGHGPDEGGGLAVAEGSQRDPVQASEAIPGPEKGPGRIVVGEFPAAPGAGDPHVAAGFLGKDGHEEFGRVPVDPVKIVEQQEGRPSFTVEVCEQFPDGGDQGFKFAQSAGGAFD
jgi:hypothetical protein